MFLVIFCSMAQKNDKQDSIAGTHNHKHMPIKWHSSAIDGHSAIDNGSSPIVDAMSSRKLEPYIRLGPLQNFNFLHEYSL